MTYGKIKVDKIQSSAEELTLPTSAGTSGQVLTSNGSGVLSFADNATGTDLTTTANGTSLTVESSSGNNVALPAATSSAWGVMSDEDKTKLDGIESSSTADQTGAEIKAAYEAESDTNAFTDADHSKLDGIESSATADQTNAEIRAAVEAATDSNVFTDADHTKLDGVAASANNYAISADLLDEDDFATDAATKAARQESSKAYVDTEVAGLIDSSPASLDTLNELAAALGDDSNYAATVTTSLGLKAPLASPAFTGDATLAGDLTVNTDAFFVDASAKNVGIGTTPYVALEVKGASAKYYEETGTAVYNLNLSGTGYPYSSPHSGAGILFGGLYNSSGDVTTFGFISAKKDNATSGNDSAYLSFGTRNNNTRPLERMRITPEGSLLIGPPTAAATTITAAGAITTAGNLVTGGNASGGAYAGIKATPTGDLIVTGSALTLFAAGNSTAKASISASTGDATFGGDLRVNHSGSAGSDKLLRLGNVNNSGTNSAHLWTPGAYYAGPTDVDGTGYKAKNIELIKNYHKWYNLQFTIVYFSNVYGAGQISEGKYATLIGIFENLYKKNKKLTVVKPGTQKRDFTHIDDTIDGILKASIGYYGDGYVIRTGTQYSILDVAKMFKTDFVFIDEQRGNRTQSSGSMENMKKLGWKSKINLKDYINNIIN